MSEHILYLKKNKSGLIHSRHPWIFDGALDMKRSGEVPAGVARLVTADGRTAAVGTYNPRSALAFRVLDRTERSVDASFFEERFEAARALRAAVLDDGTTGFRMINSEGDGLPGLIADVFDGHWTVQVGTPAVDALTPLWLGTIEKVFDPKSVTRKDSQSVANREHMTAVSEVLLGEPPEIVRFKEAGIAFEAALLPGQKTGFFFDQRDNRVKAASFSCGLRMFDGYAYTGGFGAHALASGATSVLGVESSKPACEMMLRNYALNADAKECCEVVQGDCVRFLKETDRQFDIVVLDPPALAKRRHHLPQAGKLYRDIFASGMARIAPKGGFLCAYTCSAAVDGGTLLEILRTAATSVSRSTQVLHLGGAGADHPTALHHPEGDYLKSAILRIV